MGRKRPWFLKTWEKKQHHIIESAFWRNKWKAGRVNRKKWSRQKLGSCSYDFLKESSYINKKKNHQFFNHGPVWLLKIVLFCLFVVVFILIFYWSSFMLLCVVDLAESPVIQTFWVQQVKRHIIFIYLYICYRC